MGDKSNIEWTDATWNPVRGCVKVSPGCANCYAETFAERWRGVKGHPYEQGFDLRLVPEKLAEPLRWKKPRRVFVNSMSDLFQDGVPDDYIDQCFAVMALAREHTFQILTKRPERMHAYLDESGPHIIRWVGPAGTFERIKNAAESMMKRDVRIAVRWPLPNVWLGVSVENRHFRSRIDELRETPAAVRFISIEPLLEDIGILDLHGIDWVIVGGESGHGARPFDMDWARDIRAQCRAHGVAFFFKQAGSQPYDSDLTASGRSEVLHFHSKKGGDMAEWSADLRVREFPR